MTGRTRHPGQKKDRPRGVQSRHPRVYVRGSKPPGALVCADCGLVQHRGKWTRGAPPLTRLARGRCPACQRIRDRYPAGTLRLSPAFLERRAEVLQLIRNVERAEKAEHPLERLMEVEESDGRLVVTTTGVHLARQIRASSRAGSTAGRASATRTGRASCAWTGNSGSTAPAA